jgi:tRNA(fMet)-specific endonuclease VapC
MEAIVLDTDVFSFLYKADTRAQRYAADVAGRELCLCFQTVAEVRLWSMERNWSRQRQEKLAEVLRRYVVLPYDSEMADRWAQVTLGRKRLGRPINCGDAWIAAAALRHDVSLLTHNAQDYQDIPGLKLITHSDTPA